MMKTISSIVLFCVITCKISAMVAPQSKGHKYDLELQKVLPMNDTDYVKFEGLKVKRYNRTFYVADGKFSMNGVFDDTWTVEAKCWRSKLGNNQWELTSFQIPPTILSKFIKDIYIPYIQPDLTPYSNLPVYEDSEAENTFPDGTYVIENYVGDIQNFPPHLQDGVYRIEIFLAKDDMILSGFIIYWKVYPEIG